MSTCDELNTYETNVALDTIENEIKRLRKVAYPNETDRQKLTDLTNARDKLKTRRFRPL